MTEAGYPGLEANGWFGMFVPGTTPKPIVDKLGAEVAAIVNTPEMHKRLTDMGLIAVGSLPGDFKAQIDKDAVHWKNMAEAAKISMD
ncbi:Tripartite tricarboxylate transporter family receptor [compost metagenome]